MGEFRLEVREFRDLSRWRWALTGPGGDLVVDHEVRLDAGCWQFEAFGDLHGYLRLHAAPDRRIEDETRIVTRVGEWIGAEVLGPVAEALAKARPGTVRVGVSPGEPVGAQELLFRPLGLGDAGGTPLALQDVTMVMETGGTQDASPVGERLRVLGLFSMPVGTRPLNLRRERHTLVRTLLGIGARGRVVDVRVLQYGVTRDRLREMLAEDEGWDVIHVSGHGLPGELILEKADGSPDGVTAKELADLLDGARERLKLVTVSTCWSAALASADQHQLLGLPTVQAMTIGDDGHSASQDAGTGCSVDQGHGADHSTEDAEGANSDSSSASGTLAAELTRRLGCAVLAMRYPVTDDFAIALAEKLYDLLVDKGRPLPRAVGTALREVVAVPPTAACPALSFATPALAGALAADLRLTAPRRVEPASHGTRLVEMPGFPIQPDRFVGRTAAMARASAALAPRSRVPGVLLHGMPGGGKTFCALELAYTHEHTFDRLVWYKAPELGQDITGSLTDFALTLERALPGFRMVHTLADDAELAAFTPCLTELVEQRRVLIVIDNMESLLSDSGQWRDVRWGQVIRALTTHGGSGRVMMTSRRRPADVTGVGGTGTGSREPGPRAGTLDVLQVDALSLDEALLLARELPHLSALIDGRLPGIGRNEARTLALRVLNIAQGHPMLLELADRQAADPQRLATLVQVGDHAWRRAGGLPEGFFTTGEAGASGEDYLHVLAAWSTVVGDGLTSGQRTMFRFLCCLEERDRIRPVVDHNWTDLWTRLELAGDPPDPGETLAILTESGLVTVQPETYEAKESYVIHPSAAEAGRAQAGSQFRNAVDTELAAYWKTIFREAWDSEADGWRDYLIVCSGLSGARYLMRLGEMSMAAVLLDAASQHEKSRETAAVALPILRAIVATGRVPGADAVLARVLELVDPAAAEHRIRAAMQAALDRGDYRTATAVAGALINRCSDTGRLTEALALADKRKEYTKRAGLGPWTLISDDVHRVQLQAAMGKAEHVLAEVQRLRREMDRLPITAGEFEAVPPWSVREVLLSVGSKAAIQVKRWGDALELNGEIVASQQARGAQATEIARTRFNACAPLISLGRISDAEALLRECRQVFEDVHDISLLGKVVSALANLEAVRGHGEPAIKLEMDALRYEYIARDVQEIAGSHHNLGTYLHFIAGRSADALAHHLAAAVIHILAGAGTDDASIRAAASDLRALGADAMMPARVADLCHRVAEVPGVELDQLLGSITQDSEEADIVLRELTARVRVLATAASAALGGYLASWDPVLAAIFAADTDRSAAAALDAHLNCYQDSAAWGALVAALRRLRTGEADLDLLVGLDEISAAIMTRAIDARDGKTAIPAALWPAMGLGQLLSWVTAGASGNDFGAAYARRALSEIAADPDLARLAASLGRILDGERDQALPGPATDPVHRAVIETVLQHLGAT